MKYLLPLAIALAGQPVTGEIKLSFEGRISYLVTVESRHEKIPEKLLVESYGTRTTIYYKRGNTRMEWHGGRAEWEIYLAAENRHYLKIGDQPALQVSDGSEEDRELLDFRDEASNEVVLGHSTREVSVEYTDGTVSKYWYDPEIYMDPAPFRNLKFAHLNRYWQTAQAPYLKHERTTELSRVVYTATAISSEPIADDLFSIPKLAGSARPNDPLR